jgi:hypothetical protein
MKKFCIIAVDYEYHVPRTPLNELVDDSDVGYGTLMENSNVTSIHKGLKSIANQTYRDFNFIICHDGPKEKTYEEEGVDFKSLGLEPILLNTQVRNNDWGHSSRDFAMRYAYENNLGEYFIIINIDNILFENALDEISKSIENNQDCPIFIYNIINSKIRDLNTWKEHWFPQLLRGVPVILGNIDVMQFVAHRAIWKIEGFWYDKTQMSDGIIYEQVAKKYKFKEIFRVLGINY